ncbi:hypothetical protein ACOTET_22870 [Achromobacter xylosoxidans]
MQNDIEETRRAIEALKRQAGSLSGLESTAPQGDNRSMDYIPRAELNAKLEALEARLEGRVARIEDAVQRIAESTKEIRDENRATQAKVSGLKAIIVTTAIGSVIAIVLGVAAFNATLTSNMLSAFLAGLQSSAQGGPTIAKPQQ